MTKIKIQYLEQDGGEVHTETSIWHNEYLPRVGERIYIEGHDRRVTDVKHYQEFVVVTAFRAADYPAVNETIQERMNEIFDTDLSVGDADE